MMNLPEFVAFLIFSAILLVIVGIKDKEIRAWEDEQIKKIKSIVDKTSKKN